MWEGESKREVRERRGGGGGEAEKGRKGGTTRLIVREISHEA